MTLDLGIEPRPHWWEARALTTLPSLLSMVTSSVSTRNVVYLDIVMLILQFDTMLSCTNWRVVVKIVLSDFLLFILTEGVVFQLFVGDIRIVVQCC